MYAPAQNDCLDDLSDADLLQQFRSGSDEALEVLLRRHAEDLYRFCCHLVPSREDAEDICQESLARAIDRVDSLHLESAFKGWLFRIARNLSIDSFRSKRRTCTLVDDERTPAPLRVDGPHTSVETGEEHQIVAQALGMLAQSHQRVLLLREVEGLSYADISRRLGISQSAVETLLFRARRRLREEYCKRDGPPRRLGLAPSLSSLLSRWAAPLVGGGHAAAKVALTFAVAGGTVLTASPFPTALRTPSLGLPQFQIRSPLHRMFTRHETAVRLQPVSAARVRHPLPDHLRRDQPRQVRPPAVWSRGDIDESHSRLTPGPATVPPPHAPRIRHPQPTSLPLLPNVVHRTDARVGILPTAGISHAALRSDPVAGTQPQMSSGVASILLYSARSLPISTGRTGQQGFSSPVGVPATPTVTMSAPQSSSTLGYGSTATAALTSSSSALRSVPTFSSRAPTPVASGGTSGGVGSAAPTSPPPPTRNPQATGTVTMPPTPATPPAAGGPGATPSFGSTQ